MDDITKVSGQHPFWKPDVLNQQIDLKKVKMISSFGLNCILFSEQRWKN